MLGRGCLFLTVMALFGYCTLAHLPRSDVAPSIVSPADLKAAKQVCAAQTGMVAVTASDLGSRRVAVTLQKPGLRGDCLTQFGKVQHISTTRHTEGHE